MSKEEQIKAVLDLSHYQMGVEDTIENIIRLLEDELEYDWDDMTATRDAIIRSLIRLIKGEQK